MRDVMTDEKRWKRDCDDSISGLDLGLQRAAIEARHLARQDMELMRTVFERARAALEREEFEVAFMSFDELHRRAASVQESAMSCGYVLAMIAAKSLCRVLEGMVNPARASLDAINGHLEALSMIFHHSLRSHEDERGQELLRTLDSLRYASAEESLRARTDSCAPWRKISF